MATDDLFSDHPARGETVTFEPTRAAGLARLERFASRTGAHYASQRNYDLGPDRRSTVSSLSPWIRHRLITEEDVLTQTLARHSTSAAEKFLQEVFWRGYFKGWLEQHPSVWQAYETDLAREYETLDINNAFKLGYSDAIEGRTGIACFDHWAQELVQTGYLHNHARMWFASIWIFTLQLPWQLGADFFMQHLLDGDPASNTLSWRWVGGLHTKGKTYLARASNIEKYTGGQFNPVGQLASQAVPLLETQEHPLIPLAISDPIPKRPALLLITPDDCHPESALHTAVTGVVGLQPPMSQSAQVQAFRQAALEDAITRNEAGKIIEYDGSFSPLIEAAQAADVRDIVTAKAPVGPIATQLAAAKVRLAQDGITLHQIMRPYDALTWTHANKGFFKVKKKIPYILRSLGLGG